MRSLIVSPAVIQPFAVVFFLFRFQREYYSHIGELTLREQANDFIYIIANGMYEKWAREI